MNISGIGFYMSSAAVGHYDRLAQGFGKFDYSNQYKPEVKNPLEEMPAAEIELSVNKAIEQKNADKEIEQFSTFVGSDTSGASTNQGFSEEWTRPIENFVLNAG